MPREELTIFLRSLDTYDGDPRTAIALRRIVLTMTRTTELRAAQWPEFENLEGSEPLWRVPAERMKMKTEHLVPLQPQAVAVLKDLRAMPGAGNSSYLFQSPSREGFMSNKTMLYGLYRLGFHSPATVHGFRGLSSTILNEMGFNSDWTYLRLGSLQSFPPPPSSYEHSQRRSARATLSLCRWPNRKVSLPSPQSLLANFRLIGLWVALQSPR